MWSLRERPGGGVSFSARSSSSFVISRTNLTFTSDCGMEDGEVIGFGVRRLRLYPSALAGKGHAGPEANETNDDEEYMAIQWLTFAKGLSARGGGGVEGTGSSVAEDRFPFLIGGEEA